MVGDRDSVLLHVRSVTLEPMLRDFVEPAGPISPAVTGSKT